MSRRSSALGVFGARDGRAAATLVASLVVTAVACSAADTRPGPGAGTGIQVVASGETLALGGFTFPPAGSDEPFFVDGWSMRFTKVLVTFGDVVISRAPDTDRADPTRVGAVVARARGPWAVDLHKGGPLTARGGDGQAVAVTTLANQTENAGAPFAPDEKYAFGFDVVRASAAATRINVDADDPDYAAMIANGYTVLYAGTATFRGGDCAPSPDPVLDALPRSVDFRLGFASPVSYVNCENPDLGAAGGEGNPRGLFVKGNAPTVAQLTIHVDHAFWSANEEDLALRFDVFALAAQKKAAALDAGAPPPVTLEDLSGVPLTAMAIGGTTLPNRACKPAGAPPVGALSYDPKGGVFADVRALIGELQTAQGHLNGSGLCATKKGN